MKQEILSMLIQNITPIVVSVVGSLVSVVLVKFNSFIKTKTQNEKAIQASSVVTDIVEMVVTSLGQTVVTEMKKKTEDGNLTLDDARQVKSMAVDSVLRQLPDEIRKNIKLVSNSLPETIEHKIEQIVSFNKIQ